MSYATRLDRADWFADDDPLLDELASTDVSEICPERHPTASQGITARVEGVCLNCEQPIGYGDPLAWDRLAGWTHKECA